uniref:Phosphatidate cytidylyltransferase n=1 Tax=Chromera velia CCMP2878 TaxID=1169474 RepID=A0A0G4G1C1_9ALVE|eukprot:Cvel_19727.t1-p1 / transcript=Cvel_19727.t1 / gene=Cvel_19727 / organism=Chromera_velia_CCMP2878 / gene_product=Phosphatidate cytidylyltransferase 1, putative / transcript_product=Phosphatidate cytidylyltransferase 1, putative / location=Cvel_scaffold1724:27503-34246(+) / protein_length=533 / sequence_SO=supercontig / SO=protein_coding / is_pseudo=false
MPSAKQQRNSTTLRSHSSPVIDHSHINPDWQSETEEDPDTEFDDFSSPEAVGGMRARRAASGSGTGGAAASSSSPSGREERASHAHGGRGGHHQAAMVSEGDGDDEAERTTTGGGGRGARRESQKEKAEKEWKKKLRTFAVRFRWTFALLAVFFATLALGKVYVSFGILLITIGIYREILRIKRNYLKDAKLPLFYFLRWYFFSLTTLLVSTKWLSPLFHKYAVEKENDVLLFFLRYHTFFAFLFLVVGFIMFILSLRKFSLRYQFEQIAWIVITNLVVNIQAQAQVANLFNGMIWFVLPVCLVICNDIWAYMWGITLGRTPLIALSPKKTWEGFIGGFFSTLFFGVLAATWLQQWSWFVCPENRLVFRPLEWIWEEPCDVSQVLHWYRVTISKESFFRFLLLFSSAEDRASGVLWISNFQLHAIVLSFFAGIIAPFGGFFASGLKRAFKLKDFGETIPGHGGLTDRFDCQLLMGMFTFIYVNSFVYQNSPLAVARISAAAPLSFESIKQAFDTLPLDQQRQLAEHFAGVLGS